MPADDVSDLRDVFDAINRLCDTMKTSHYEPEDAVDETETATGEVIAGSVHRYDTVPDCENVTYECDETATIDTKAPKMHEEMTSEFYSPTVPSDTTIPKALADETVAEEPKIIAYTDCSYEIVTPENAFRTIDSYRSERWSDSLASLPVESAACEPLSEMYYTASSEVSLLSDVDVPIVQERLVDEDSLEVKDDRDERRECVIAGHVAAMRERFESMTRTNTPCPDLMRSSSPSLDVFRNITPSPDLLG